MYSSSDSSIWAMIGGTAYLKVASNLVSILSTYILTPNLATTGPGAGDMYVCWYAGNGSLYRSTTACR